MQGLKKKCYSLPHQPGFLYGAPGGFVNLSVLSMGEKELDLETRLRKENYAECLVGAGLMNSFATSHAVAHYQGTSTFSLIGQSVIAMDQTCRQIGQALAIQCNNFVMKAKQTNLLIRCKRYLSLHYFRQETFYRSQLFAKYCEWQRWPLSYIQTGNVFPGNNVSFEVYCDEQCKVYQRFCNAIDHIKRET